MTKAANNSLTFAISPSPRPAASTVRRLIRNVKSKQYFKAGGWTTDPALADQFPDAGKVIEACIQNHLVDVELVLQLIGDPEGAFETHLRLMDHVSRPARIDQLSQPVERAA